MNGAAPAASAPAAPTARSATSVETYFEWKGGSTESLPELSGKNTKQDSDGQGQIKSNHPFQEIHIALDFGNACLVIGHGPCGGSRFLFAGSCFDQCIVDFLDDHITRFPASGFALGSPNGIACINRLRATKDHSQVALSPKPRLFCLVIARLSMRGAFRDVQNVLSAMTTTSLSSAMSAPRG